MDFYRYSSLFNFLKNFKLYTSLSTKLYLLYSAALGLLFLHRKNIFHLDFKPQNLLIGVSLLLKVNDLGEAFHPEVCDANFRPGLTPVYSLPEVFLNWSPISEKTDIYSLGVTIFQTISINFLSTYAAGYHQLTVSVL